MRIKLTGKNAYQGLEAGDDTSFASVVQSLGHQIVEGIREAEVTVCVDYSKNARRELLESRKLGIKTVLIQQEPYVVIPEHRRLNPGGVFDLVLRVGIPGEVTRSYANSWAPAQDWSSKRANRFVAITANKWSALPGQLYTLRRRAYASSCPIDLYGIGWDRSWQKHLLMIGKEIVLAIKGRALPQLPTMADFYFAPCNYLGPVEDKVATLAKYDYSLVIENSGHYMSEKLMDSLLAGNLPVYVGAPITHFGIPEQFVIQANPTLESVKGKINQALEIDPLKHRRELADWISNPSVASQWRAEFSIRRIVGEIETFLREVP